MLFFVGGDTSLHWGLCYTDSSDRRDLQGGVLGKQTFEAARVSHTGGRVDQWEHVLLQAFDNCFDAAHANGGDEEACTPLVGAAHTVQDLAPQRPQWQLVDSLATGFLLTCGG